MFATLWVRICWEHGITDLAPKSVTILYCSIIFVIAKGRFLSHTVIFHWLTHFKFKWSKAWPKSDSRHAPYEIIKEAGIGPCPSCGRFRDDFGLKKNSKIDAACKTLDKISNRNLMMSNKETMEKIRFVKVVVRNIYFS